MADTRLGASVLIEGRVDNEQMAATTESPEEVCCNWDQMNSNSQCRSTAEYGVRGTPPDVLDSIKGLFPTHLLCAHALF